MQLYVGMDEKFPDQEGIIEDLLLCLNVPLYCLTGLSFFTASLSPCRLHVLMQKRRNPATLLQKNKTLKKNQERNHSVLLRPDIWERNIFC